MICVISFSSVGARNIVFKISLIQESLVCDRGFIYLGRSCFTYIWEEYIQFFTFSLAVWSTILTSVVLGVFFQCYYVINRASFCNFCNFFLQLPIDSQIIRIYVAWCFKLVPGILNCKFLQLLAFLHATFITYCAKCKSAIQKTCFKTVSIQFCSLWWPIRTE